MHSPMLSVRICFGRRTRPHPQALSTGALPHVPVWLVCAVWGQGREVACNLPGPSILLARPPSIQPRHWPPGLEGGSRPAWEDGWRRMQSCVSGTVAIEVHGLGIPGATQWRRLGPPHLPALPWLTLTQAFGANRQKQLHLVCNEILTSKGRAAVSWDWAPGPERLCSWPMPDSAGHRAKSRRTFDHPSPGSQAGDLRSLVMIC